MSLRRAWIADLSPTLKVVIDDRGNLVLTRHGTETTVVNSSEARKLLDAMQATRKEA